MQLRFVILPDYFYAFVLSTLDATYKFIRRINFQVPLLAVTLNLLYKAVLYLYRASPTISTASTRLYSFYGFY